MEELLKTLGEIGIVPVVKLEDPEKALPLAKALADGGLPCAEVTFRTATAGESIRRITAEFPKMLVGAGTVLTTRQVDDALAAGATFIVSPGLNPKVVRHCQEQGIPVIPGCANPSDVEQALELGLDTVKFFPAEAMGGLKTIKAMAAPYGSLRFMPTGGVNPENLNAYLAFPKVLACGGSWMVKEELIDAGKFEEIAALTRQAVEQMLGFTLAHVGLNAGSAAQAERDADAFGRLFGLPKRETPISFFAGSSVETMKGPAFGSKGHIGFATNSCARAAAWLRRSGVALNEESARRDAQGRLTLIYLADEVDGFAVHIVQK